MIAFFKYETRDAFTKHLLPLLLQEKKTIRIRGGYYAIEIDSPDDIAPVLWRAFYEYSKANKVADVCNKVYPMWFSTGQGKPCPSWFRMNTDGFHQYSFNLQYGGYYADGTC